MKTCDSTLDAAPPSASPWWKVSGAGGLRLQASVGGPEVMFACPVCASPLRAAAGSPETAGVCPVCRSGVVAPQPEFGCRAMAYRDWLRLQEIDWGATPGTPAIPRPAAPGPAALVRRLRRPVLSTAAALAAAAIVLGGLAWTGGPKPTATAAASSAALPDAAPAPRPEPLPGAGIYTTALVTTTAPAPPPALEPAGEPAPARATPPLALVLQHELPDGFTVVVRAVRAHSFGRSTPPDDAFVCLKLTDVTDASVTTRAYVPAGGALATVAGTLVPWGRESMIAVVLRWQAAETSQGPAGHWRVESLEDATAGGPALTSAQ